ncbi:RNA dependent RNA polymerase-domain-containing protein [Bombardia bombarda]|uniref:RNA-dependent RNA polymerase n=1 Tax=Bombardia bombarda TaxID=252184 RepID=A0AA39XBW3_9PEZI|nr:RNA dependent RNA polymerase-domain-containing protein [Bombardia bombarda]
MAAFPSSSAPPSTPRKRDGTVDAIVRDLNAEYYLGIQIPDHTLTPARRRQLAQENEEYGRSDRICKGIHILYCQRNGKLDQALQSFRLEASGMIKNWRSSGYEAPRPTPRTAKAGTPDQPHELRKLLLEIIDGLKTQPTLARPFLRSNSGPSTAPERKLSPLAESPASPTGSKRPSYEGEGNDQMSKRARSRQPAAPASTYHAQTSNAFDQVPSRRRGAQEPAMWESRVSPIPINFGRTPSRPRESREPGFTTPRRDTYETSPYDLDGVASSHSSAKSSNDSLPGSIFSQGNDLLPLTQDTIESPSQKGKPFSTSPVAEVAHSDDSFYSFPLSSGERRALSRSFSRIDMEQRSPEASVVGHYEPQTYPSSPDISITSLDFSSVLDDTPLSDHEPQSTATLQNSQLSPIEQRLQNIWPVFPRWLHDAPLAIAWELTRICLHCKVDLEDSSLKYDPAWAKQGMVGIWKSLHRLDVFRGKSFPEKPAPDVFAAALANFGSKGNAVLMSAVLDFNPANTGPLFLVQMKPLQFDQSCRLTRRFGADRFLEILIPSPTNQSAPEIVRNPGGAEKVVEWLTRQQHSLAGRQWQAFYTKDAGYRKPIKEYRLKLDEKPIIKDRVHFFAETGHNFRPVLIKTRKVIPADEPVNQRSDFKVGQMLDWLLQIENNDSQPHLKLFSRIQLGLSKTYSIMIFEPNQIRHHDEDILSPIGKVMNDGIGRMSRSVARKVRDFLGLSDIPSAIQARIGSAKGMWLMDVSDQGDADWIETYPSQRKWICDYLDPFQRTLEVRSVASELRSAGLNLQFLPVLEDRAKDKSMMRQAIATRLTNDLRRQFDGQKAAFKRPLQFRQWIIENFGTRSERVTHSHVRFLAGLPDSKQEILMFLLNSGFDPKKQKFLQDLAWDLQMQKCEILKTKLNIKVGRSAYIYMVIDFWGVLEENEVHVGFSNKFRDEVDDSSYTLLADCDILVARSPAHFVSDVQKVRAVFKAELHALKDVIVFSAKGNIPLADKLSGGDYDGDMAWVCWDPEIVEGFVNAEPPAEPDLSKYITKDKTTFAELARTSDLSGSQAQEKATYDMIAKSFLFAMQLNFLGICTNYKEHLCYFNNSVSNHAAVILSSLVGNLVDQSKQGIIFSQKTWDRLRKEQFHGMMNPPEPAYKLSVWSDSTKEPEHIIDFLKFSVAKPAIDRELAAFYKAMSADQKKTIDDDEDAAHHWDPDLVVYYEDLKKMANESRTTKAILDSLLSQIGALELEWKKAMVKVQQSTQSRAKKEPDTTYPVKVSQIYEKWCAIRPPEAVSGRSGKQVDSKTVRLLEEPFLPDTETSRWALVKASTAFKTYYKTTPKFVWMMAGRQLAEIKSKMVSGREGWGGAGGVGVTVAPLMYAGLTPDSRFVKQWVARMDGDGDSGYLREGEAYEGDSDGEERG